MNPKHKGVQEAMRRGDKTALREFSRRAKVMRDKNAPERAGAEEAKRATEEAKKKERAQERQARFDQEVATLNRLRNDKGTDYGPERSGGER